MRSQNVNQPEFRINFPKLLIADSYSNQLIVKTKTEFI